MAQLTQSIVNKILHSVLTVLKESSQTPEAGVYWRSCRRLFNLRTYPGQGGNDGNGTD